MSYSPTEWRTFEPVARAAEVQARSYPDRRDLFLCHAWDDRQGAAKELYDQLTVSGATVWFSETEVGLGSPSYGRSIEASPCPGSESCS